MADPRPGRSDLPLGRDPSARFLPWIIALMVLLAVLASAGGLATRDFATRWNVALGGVLTVQVPPDSETGSAAAGTARVLEILRRTAGVAAARILGADETTELLAPWVGAEIAASLPLPTLIDVRVLPGSPIDLGALEARLDQVMPGVVVDDHGRWLSHVATLSRSLATAGAGVVALVLTTAGLVVALSVRTGLATHAEVIEILHLIGARDGYIAGRFQRHVLARATIGALLGAALAVIAILAVGLFAAVPDPLALGAAAGRRAVEALPFGPVDWLLIAAVPAAVVAVAVLTARLTVMASLGRLP